MRSHVLMNTKEFTEEKALTNTRTMGKSSANVCTFKMQDQYENLQKIGLGYFSSKTEYLRFFTFIF